MRRRSLNIGDRGAIALAKWLPRSRLFRHAPDLDRDLPRHKQPPLLANKDGSNSSHNSDEGSMVTFTRTHSWPFLKRSLEV